MLIAKVRTVDKNYITRHNISLFSIFRLRMEYFILRNLHFYLLFLLPLICESQEAECYNYRRPNAFPSDAFIKEGDILIGGIYSVRDQSKDQTNPCGGQVTNWRWQQNIQAIVYSIDKINADPTILPNVTLGFVIIDDCRNAVTALGQALSFTQGSRTSSEPGMCSGRPTSGYDVAVVLGPTSSSRSVSSNQLLSLYRIPQISPEATSDDLTDHFDHAFFMRMVPPDKNQGAAIVDLISRYNWTYISLLYSEGSYGSNLAKQVQNRARENGICIGYITAFEANDKTVDEDRMDRTVDKLLLNRKSARIAVLIMGVDHLKMLFQSLVNKQAVGQLIFIGGDTLDQRAFVEYPYAAIGAMSLAVPLNLDRDFKQYFGDLNPDKTGGNPWFFPIWESIFGCSWTSSSNCPEFDRISQFEDFFVSDWTSKTLDAVSVVALGLHRLIKETCPNAVGHRMKIRQCAEGPKLLQYLREVNFEGITGQISFDENGDLIGSYLIRQWVLENDEQVVKNIATWQKDALIEGTGNLTFLQEPKFYNAKTLGARVEESDVIPESVCSKPCQVGYIYVQKELPCCWDCLPCRDNEYVTDNGTSCHQCPLLTWPEEGDREVCELIEPTYLAITDPFGMTLALLAIFGLILTIMWTCILVRHSHRKVIKASSVPITSVIAVGFYVSFISAFIFEWKPSVASCSIGHVGFHLSCTLLYGPLSVKTVRIYRIFAASKKCRRPRHLVSLNSQMITIGFLLLVQVQIFPYFTDLLRFD